MIPDSRDSTCLPRSAADPHVVVPLDNGARLLVDEQELPASRPSGKLSIRYRTIAVDDAPYRQLRPARAADSRACLVWGDSLGAHVGAAFVGDDEFKALGRALVVVGPRTVRIDEDGRAIALHVGDGARASADGTYVVSRDGDGRAQITAIATGTVLRSWPVDAGASLEWTSRDVVEVRLDETAMLVPADPARPIRAREPDLVTSPDSALGVRVVGNTAVVVRVADGAEQARHSITAGAAVSIANDKLFLQRDGSLVVVGQGDRRIALEGATLAGRQDLSDTHVVGDGKLWDLRDGRALVVEGMTDGRLVGDEVWWIAGGEQPRLIRVGLASGARREVRLLTPGLVFGGVTTELGASTDGSRVTARYRFAGGLGGIATWNTTTGDLLWIGSDDARVIGDWVVENGRAYRPVFDVDAIIADTGARTNLRVCKADLRAVPVLPPPAATSVWAPDAACAAGR
jgi:hypothetical protein